MLQTLSQKIGNKSNRCYKNHKTDDRTKTTDATVQRSKETDATNCTCQKKKTKETNVTCATETESGTKSMNQIICAFALIKDPIPVPYAHCS